MKIVHVVESLETGGLERVVVNLARSQQASGEQPAVACIYHGGALADELKALNIEVMELNKSPGIDLGLLLRLTRRLKRTDVVHAHNHIPHYYSAIPAGLNGIPMITTRHGMGGDPSLRRERLFRLALPFSSAVVCVCQAAAEARQLETLRRRKPSKIHVIPNGTYLEPFLKPVDPTGLTLRRELGISESAIVFGTVGRLNWAKNHELMLRSFSRAFAGKRHVYLLIVGEGSKRAAVETLVDELDIGRQVLLLGERADVPDLLPSMDVFVLSSKSEGYSVALVEASAAGLPIIATAVGGNGEIVNHETTGLLVSSGDESAMTEAMVRLSGDLTLCSKLGASGRNWSMEHGSFSRMAERYAKLYERCLGG
ncbi:MAG: glycosyltransferase [Pseudomonadota bacterium]